MRNEQHGARIGVDAIFEPLDRGDVEVIGRFVQQQQVRLLHERRCQRDAPSPAAGQLAHFLLGRQVQFRDRRLDALFEVPAVVCIDLRVQRFEFAQALFVRLLP